MEIFGANNSGIDGQLVKVSVVKETARQGVNVIGNVKRVVMEGTVRAAHAIKSLEGEWEVFKDQKYLIDLSPAEVVKTSSGLDLPIAIMLLLSYILKSLDDLEPQIEEIESKIDRLQSDALDELTKLNKELGDLVDEREIILEYHERIQNNQDKYLLIGTLDIVSGKLSAPIYGMMSLIAAAKQGYKVIVPEESGKHAALVAKARQNIQTFVAANLQEVWDVILGVRKARRATYRREEIIIRDNDRYIPDLRAIDGVEKAKKAMIVALAGGHNILFAGPPGQGKTMLALASTKLLPVMSQEEMYEVNKIYSARGELGENELVLNRPFVEVSNITHAALFGGGKPTRPGLISAAHKGILFFDEINMCPSGLIEELRKPLNDRIYRVQRANGPGVEFPCNFIFVAALNPCKCGWSQHYTCPDCQRTFLGNSERCPDHPSSPLFHKCGCSLGAIEKFRSKISKPLLDRIDLKVFVSSYDKEYSEEKTYASQTIKRRIQKAREIQRRRYETFPYLDCNADVPDKSQFDGLNKRTEEYVQEIYSKYKIDTMRTRFKLILVARTLADLDEDADITREHLDQAATLMGLGHPYFGTLQ